MNARGPEVLANVRGSSLALVALPTGADNPFNDCVAWFKLIDIVPNLNDRPGILMTDDGREVHKLVGVFEFVDARIAAAQSSVRHLNERFVRFQLRPLNVDEPHVSLARL
jgi:hypothetical protein